MNIVIVCNIGMSSSLLAESMRMYYESIGAKNKIWNIDEMSLDKEYKKADVVLIAPQIKHSLKRIEKMCNGFCSVGVIDSNDYARLNGENCALLARELFNKLKKI